MSCRFESLPGCRTSFACPPQALPKAVRAVKRLEQEAAEVPDAAVQAEVERFMSARAEFEVPSLEGQSPGASELLFRGLTVLVPRIVELAQLLLAWWRRPEAQPAAALEAAQAAAARSCAYLRCANLGCKGGPAAGQGAGSQRCR